MNIKQIKYFEEALRTGSLSAAAKCQFVTVQAVSKAIADLEEELGRSLLARGSRGVQPTTFGLAFHQRAQRALESFEELETFADAYHAQHKLPELLRLGLNTPPFGSNEWVCSSIAALVEKQVGIKTSVELVVGNEGFAGLRDRKLDALITVGTFTHPEVNCSVIGTIMPAVLMHHAHPLAQKDMVALSNLEPYPVANSTWFSEYNASIVSLYREKCPHLNYTDMELKEIRSHLDRFGVVLTTGLDVMRKMKADLVLRPFTPEDAIPIPICFVSLGERALPALVVLQRMVFDWLALINREKGSSID